MANLFDAPIWKENVLKSSVRALTQESSGVWVYLRMMSLVRCAFAVEQLVTTNSSSGSSRNFKNVTPHAKCLHITNNQIALPKRKERILVRQEID